MAKKPADSFDRLYSRRTLLTGAGRSVLVWSTLGSVVLCMWLFCLYLVAELLITQGNLTLETEQTERISALIGIPADGAQVFIDDATLSFEQRGILPAVWWSRDKYWGPLLALAYRRIGLLQSNGSALVLLLLVGVGLALLGSLLRSRARQVSTKAAMAAVTNLRKTLHRQTLRLGPSDLLDSENDHVLELFTTEIDAAREGGRKWMSTLLRSPLQIALLLIFAISFHWLVALQCLIPLAACWFLVRREQERFQSARRLAEARCEAELRVLSESFRKTRLVRGHGMEDWEHEQFGKHLDRYTANVLGLDRKERLSRWIARTLIVVAGGIILFLICSRVLVRPEDLSFAGAVTLLTLFACLHFPMQALWDLPVARRKAARSAERIYRYLDRIPEVGQAVGAKFLQPLSSSIQFESVSYALPDKRKLLDGIDLKLPAGEVVAVVSLDPLEAQALAYLLPRFIEPQSGRVLFDGEDITWVTLESLRAETVFVGETDPFFTGTVFENITCGNRDYSLQEVTEASKETHAHNFIAKLPSGYETVLGEHGEQLDAGQGFRLGLARAVLRDPALMVIAEPNETLDDDTKSLLDDAYNRIMRNRTLLFLPSRLSTLRRADRIILIHRGKVEAVGSYATLVRKSALYRHWEYVRFSEFSRKQELVT